MTNVFDTAFFASTIALTVPLVFPAVGELISEWAGVINIGLEGMVLTGAFASFSVAWLTKSIAVGIVGGCAAGMVLAAIMALLSIKAKADQILVGIGINIAAAGLTAFVNDGVFGGQEQIVLQPLTPYPIPLLSQIPVLGRPLFDQIPLTYLAYVLVPLLWLVARTTSWGLALRAAGEAPDAVDAAGLSVGTVRTLAVLAAGAGSGLGGAALCLGTSGVFDDGMTNGKGFIALAAVVVGRWSVAGGVAACLLFAGADALELRLQTVGTIPVEVWVAAAIVIGAIAIYVLLERRRRMSARPRGYGWKPMLVIAAALVGAVAAAILRPGGSLPAELWLMLPYLTTLAVLAGLAGERRMPRVLGLPYERVRQEA